MVLFAKAALVPRALGGTIFGLHPVTAIAGGFLLGMAIGGLLATGDVRERIENMIPVEVRTMFDSEDENKQECTCPNCLRRRRKARKRQERGGQYTDYYESDEDEVATNYSGQSSRSSQYPASNYSGFSTTEAMTDDDDDDLYTVSKSVRHRLRSELPDNQNLSSYSLGSSSRVTPFSSSSYASGQTTPNSKID